MNLTIQAHPLSNELLTRIGKLSQCTRSQRLTPSAYRFDNATVHHQINSLCDENALDHFWSNKALHLSDFGLFITDMDSTLINIECIDEIADLQGVKPQVAEITAAAMRGEIDYSDALLQRVRLLAGLPETALAVVHEQRLRLNSGAVELLQKLQQAGLYTVLVSGGFSYFTERLQALLGFDEAYANQLEIYKGRLTGQLTAPVVDPAAKAAHLNRIIESRQIAHSQVIAVGDGANDIPMLQQAGLAIAYRPKPALRQYADCILDHAGLDGILNLFEPI